jgi:hypothetical protein
VQVPESETELTWGVFRKAGQRSTHMAGDVKHNLSFARRAVEILKPKMKLVANWDQNSDQSAEGILRTTGDEQKSIAAWDNADKCVYGQLRQTDKWQLIMNPNVRADKGLSGAGIQKFEDIKTLSDLVSKFSCGNCAELAASAFVFLHKLNVRPLDYMVLDGADHAFVVIGREADSDDWRKWGKSAVVCDPWAFGYIGTDDSDPNHVRSGRFGDPFTVYTADLLGTKMKTMFPSFTGVLLAFGE